MSDIMDRLLDTTDRDAVSDAREEIAALRAEVERLTGERDRQYQQNAEQITRIAALEAENEKLRAALDILQKAMTAKKPIPMAFKKAIIEARAALEEKPTAASQADPPRS